MKRMLFFIFSVSIVNGTSAQQDKAKGRIDSLLEYYSQTFDYNGAAFVSYKGKSLLKKAYGYNDRYNNTKNRTDNIFMVGSITKQFTAELILMLAKENRLDLQDRLSKYYPDFPSGKQITIEHLLTHTSGLYNYTEDTFWIKHPEMSLSQHQMLSVFKDKPLRFEPGSKFEYSNSGYILLTYIIEQITGKPYTVIARERILTPLGMTNSGFDYTNLKHPRKVTCYEAVIADSFYVAAIEDSTQSLGAGALFSTADDLYKWHRALQSYRFLDKEWQQMAYRICMGKYGYGWFVTDDFCGQKVVAHSGAIAGFYTQFARIEKDDLCIVLLTNVRASAINLNEVSKNIIRCVYDDAFKIPAIRKEIDIDPGVLKDYEGEYVLAADTTVSITFELKGKYLYETVKDQPTDRIYPQTSNFFFVKSADAQFEFVKGEHGRFILFLHQHGQKFEAVLRY